MNSLSEVCNLLQIYFVRCWRELFLMATAEKRIPFQFFSFLFLLILELHYYIITDQYQSKTKTKTILLKLNRVIFFFLKH